MGSLKEKDYTQILTVASVGGWAVHVEIEISVSLLVRSHLLKCSSEPADWIKLISNPVYSFILPPSFHNLSATNSLKQKNNSGLLLLITV